MCRVFKDRLIDEGDREWFNENVTELVNSQFRIRIEKNELFGESPIMWGDLLKLDAPIKLYEEISNKNKLFKQLESSLDDYNASHTGKMNLVFFDDCMDHILRIARILRQPRGNAMMIGVGGSGKQSATRLASHMLEIEFRQVEITKKFGPSEFKEFLKELMFTAGIDRTPICFTITDNQIISELFVEDINSILNTGEVSNLMEQEDKDKIVEGVRPVLAQLGRVDTLENINATFIEGVRDFLHINLCMSPVGDTLRVRCRMFPSLVNCCTLDWFSRWPESALFYVSSEFLSDLQLSKEDHRKGLAEMCMIIHTTVEELSEEFFKTLRRRIYTTPKSYLDLINLYLVALEQKRTEFNINKTRLSTGIKKLTDTNTNIAELREKIKELQPKLQKKSEDLKVSLIKATEDRKIADEKEEIVSKEAAIVNQQADEAQVIVDDVQADLNQVQPELDAAKASLAKLDKSQITEIRSFPNPPEAVVMVMEAVMIVFNKKTEWNQVKSAIADPKGFVDSMKNFDVKSLDQKRLTVLRKKYIQRKDFVPAEVETKSLAAKSMCEWVLALDKYAYVLKKVAPKQEKYEEVSKVLKQAKDALAIKQAELKEVTDKVAALEAACLSMEQEKKQLEEDMDRCEKRMGRAEKLVVLLEDEGIRWKDTVDAMVKEIEELVGNVFISSACISYFGGFTGVYRQKLVDKWLESVKEKGIPVSENFSLIKVMGDPVTIRGWNIAGLPTDQVSIENGILSTQAQRWPLMIDPEEQANKWIKNIGKDDQLEVLKFTTPNFLRTLGGAVSIGRPVLVEDIGELLDPGIDPILLKQVFKSGSGIKQIRIGDSNLDYDDNFKFYMTTKLPNPHYLPEI
jgi:dynein heavy chain, axonemal